jgi:hypothetical protein
MVPNRSFCEPWSAENNATSFLHAYNDAAEVIRRHNVSHLGQETLLDNLLVRIRAAPAPRPGP